MSNAPWVTTPKRQYTVKNLGWLLRHWKEVDQVILYRQDKYSCLMQVTCYGERVSNKLGEAFTYRKGMLPWVYSCQWGDFSICLNWLYRPNFRGTELIIVNQDGTKEYRQC